MSKRTRVTLRAAEQSFTMTVTKRQAQNVRILVHSVVVLFAHMVSFNNVYKIRAVFLSRNDYLPTHLKQSCVGKWAYPIAQFSSFMVQ